MSSGIEKEPWFLYARDYVEGYELPHKFGATHGEKDPLSMPKIEKAKRSYLNSRPPTAEEIMGILSSRDDLRTKIALGAMVLKPLPDYEVMKKIISFWNHPSRVHRDFASRCLVKIQKNQIKDFPDLGDMILQYANNTSDQWVLSNSIRILGKFNNPKYLPFIVIHLKKHDNKMLYYSSFEALKEMEDKYFEQVRSRLRREGDTATLEKLDQTQKFWMKWHGTNDPATDSIK
jgi:hypothetical protein